VPAALAANSPPRGTADLGIHAAIAGYLARLVNGAPRALPERLEPKYGSTQARYGENPGQEGAVYGVNRRRLATLAHAQREDAFVHNYLDIEARSRSSTSSRAAAVVVKHESRRRRVAPTVAGPIPMARDADALSRVRGGSSG